MENGKEKPAYTLWGGDFAVYTGEQTLAHGAMSYGIRMLEGYRKGETIWTYQAPDSENVKAINSRIDSDPSFMPAELRETV